MKQEKLELQTEEDLKHYLVNGSLLTLPDEELQKHLDEIDKFLWEVRAGKRELHDKHFEPIFQRKSEITVALAMRRIKSECGRVDNNIRECLDLEWR